MGSSNELDLVKKILLLGSVNYDNKFPLHIVTQTIMNWAWFLSC
jgi:hypothetical protein